MSDKVKITYPELPANLVGNLNDLITALSSSSYNLGTYGGNVKGFMHQTGGAVQNVANISSGKTTRTLVDTWYYTTVDGSNAHTSMTTVSGHLNKPVSTLDQNLLTVIDGMSAIQTLQASNGEVPKDQADGIRQQISDLTGALNNIGLALDAAAKLINSHNNGMPLACATGFQIGGTYPTFADNAFDNSKMNMSGKNGSGSGDGAQAIRNAVSDPDEAAALIELAQEEGANLNDVAALLNKGATPEQVVNWLSEGVSTSDTALLLSRGGMDADLAASWVQGLDSDQLAALRARAAQNPKMDADNLEQLVDPKLEYDPNPKHAQSRPGVGAEPADGQRALNNSVSINSSTTTRRIGVDPQTGEIVTIDDTNNGYYHGHVRTWGELTDQMRNSLYNNGLIDKKGRIILRDAQGNITGYGINVIKGR